MEKILEISLANLPMIMLKNVFFIFISKSVTTFIPPYGTPTTLRVTNHVTVPVVIDMLLKKFQVRFILLINI